MGYIPDKSNKERRGYPRSTAPVYYRYPRTSFPRHEVNSISLGGLRIYSDELLKEGTQIEIEFFLPMGYSAIGLPPGSQAFYDVGLEFIDLPLEAINKIKSILR